VTHEQTKEHRVKRRNRAAALLSLNPAHIRHTVQRPLKGMGSYVRRAKHQGNY
jgi:stalled ribosome alternative rescue factor ArfA